MPHERTPRRQSAAPTGALEADRGRLPNFLVVGAMRSGTTSLARSLGSHPDVFMAPGKEVHFFDRKFELGLDWYKLEFAGVTTERAVGEATQTYMYNEEAVRRMAEALPGCRLIAILRDPVERAYSHYWHNRARGKETLGFGEAVEAEPERLASPGLRDQFSYLDRGRYLGQLQRLCEYFPRDALLVLVFEDFRDSSADVYQRVCRFLEVDDSFRPPILGDRLNKFVMFRSVGLRNRTRRLRPRLRNALGRWNARDSSYPPMPPEVRTELVGRFEEENAALASWLGRELSAWNTTAHL
jgi:hypothetical protein